jgi:[ribosomal protein S5]-alanine N-acetyltransferase
LILPAAADAVLCTARLHIEPQHHGHAAELFEALRDERLYRFIPQEPPSSLAQLQALYALREHRLSPDGDELWLNWTLRRRDNAHCIGTVQATVRQDDSVYFAYELGAAFWGRGFATEACRAVLAHLRDAFGARRAEAEVDTRNEASIRLLDRLGFERRALTRAADEFKGAVSDEYRYELQLGAGPSSG